MNSEEHPRKGKIEGCENICDIQACPSSVVGSGESVWMACGEVTTQGEGG